jgi:hypothetical protein
MMATLRVRIIAAAICATLPSLALAQAPPLSPAASQAGPRNAVIRGRIFAADTGKPLRRAQVTLTAPELGGPRNVNTGLDGRYEFKDLPAARYTLTARRSGYLQLRYGQRRPMELARPLQLGTSQTLENVDLTLPRTGLIAGRVLDDAGEPIAGVTVQALRPAWVEGRRQLVIAAMTSGFQGTDDTGEFTLTGLPPGSYYLRATTRETWTVVTAGVRGLMGFADTFYPGTANAGDARLVEIGVGQRVGNADIALVTGRPMNVSGTAFDSQGRPVTGRSITLQQVYLREFAGGGGSNVATVPVGADGSFVFRNITPGEYRISISTGNVGAGEGEVGRLDVMVRDTDLDNLRITTTAGWSVAGRIVAEDGNPPQMPRTGVRLGATTLLQMAYSGAGASEVRDDWTFTVKTILGAARLFAVVPDGWMVKSIRSGDRDITSTVLDLRSGEQLSDVEVVVTDRLTRVSGQLADDRGAPLANGTIVVFPEEAERWGDSSAFVRTARPDQQGNYEIKGLPAGDYLAVALDYVQDLSWNDPEYLEALRRDAQKFTLADGASHALSLKITSP